ncbi:MAG: hypothetical protein JEZ12_18390 [Desulfobacterium sp.]|nr:hypothetical protein [Desulfobacterium sp.]
MEETKFNIGDLHRISNSVPGNKEGGRKDKPSEGFDTILENTLADNAPGEALTDTKKYEPSSLGEIYAPVPTMPMDDTILDLPTGIDTALDLFQRYTELLGDASKSLRDIAPTLTDLTQQTQRLAEQVQDAPSTDTRLVAIIDHMLSTATLEQFKMERGDYIDR